MGKYDLTMKRLTSEFPEDYVRFVLKVERFAGEDSSSQGCSVWELEGV